MTHFVTVNEKEYIIPENKILNILCLGGGPIALFLGYKLRKRHHRVTLFEKRKKYTRHNILSLKETTKLDTLSLIPSEIMDELNSNSSFAHLNADIVASNKKCYKSVLKDAPYIMASSRIYFIVLNELENAYEKYFKLCGGTIIRPESADAFSNIKVENNMLYYAENGDKHSIDMSTYDIIFVNDGANSFYRNIYFKSTSYTEKVGPNILRYGLDKDNKIVVSGDVKPFAYGLTLIYNIENKEEFQEKFRTKDKLKNDTDFGSVLELETSDLNKLTVKEILLENANRPKSTANLGSQNLFRMFVCENYLYISIMVNPRDLGDFNVPGGNILFDDLPPNVQIYIIFALYYYDLSELIDPRSRNNNIRMFPLNFTCVEQSCSFIKKERASSESMLKRLDSSVQLPSTKEINENCNINDAELINKTNKNHYQFILLCGDAMASGNFHAGIVLNRNLIAVNTICQYIDEYIDSYPKDPDGNLNNNFLRLMFFHGNMANQSACQEIISKSIDALINFGALDLDTTAFDLSLVLLELNEIILCKNCESKNRLMCKNSASFVKFVVENANNEVMQRILKYLLLPDKYKYKNDVGNGSNPEFV